MQQGQISDAGIWMLLILTVLSLSVWFAMLAYLTADLEVLEEDHHEYVKAGHPPECLPGNAFMA